VPCSRAAGQIFEPSLATHVMLDPIEDPGINWNLTPITDPDYAPITPYAAGELIEADPKRHQAKANIKCPISD
jgi:hypothetical protein